MMTQLTKLDRMLIKHKNRVVPKNNKPTVLPSTKALDTTATGTQIIFNPNPNSVPMNEHSIDVSHMTGEQQRILLSMLRSGQDLDGVPRVCTGVEKTDKDELVLKNYRPRYDKSATLV